MKKPVKLGALSLLLCVSILMLVTLSVLTLSIAHADYSMAVRQSDNVKESYQAEIEAETWLAEVSEAIANNTAYPQGTKVNGNIVSIDAGNTEGHYVHAEVDISVQPCKIIVWQSKNNMGEREVLNDLYQG